MVHHEPKQKKFKKLLKNWEPTKWAIYPFKFKQALSTDMKINEIYTLKTLQDLCHKKKKLMIFAMCKSVCALMDPKINSTKGSIEMNIGQDHMMFLKEGKPTRSHMYKK